MTLYEGTRWIELLCFGRGNTRGDAVVFLPREHVVLTGDLLTYPIPFAFNAYLSEWIRALHQIRALGATTIVPGHGAPQSDTRYLDLVTRFLTFVRDETRRAVRANLTEEQTAKRIDLAPWRSAFAQGDSTVATMFDEYMPAAIQSGYDEAKHVTRHE